MKGYVCVCVCACDGCVWLARALSTNSVARIRVPLNTCLTAILFNTRMKSEEGA